jgi:hypothetical protein
LIAFHGSFQQCGTYNVLLEYADCGTLEDYFAKTYPPSSGEDIITFWERLFNVIKALSKIHDVRPPKGAGGPDIFQGYEDTLEIGGKDNKLTSCRWHQDVRPKNVLVIRGRSTNPYDVEFKLADLGLSHFQRTTAATIDAAGRDTWGTREYGEQMVGYFTTLHELIHINHRRPGVLQMGRLHRTERIGRQTIHRHMVIWMRL